MTLMANSTLADAPDKIVEARVDAAIAAGVALPRWGWKTPGPYNGSTGAARVAGWQKLQLACRRGWHPWPTACSICGHDEHLHSHTELYQRPLLSKPICRPCHYRLHRRFRDPEPWLSLVRQHSQTWAIALLMTELTRRGALILAQKADPFAVDPEPR